MISSLLNLANAFLELLNTPFGQAATRIALVTTALTGLMGVLKGYMAFAKGTTFATIASGVVDFGKAIVGAIGGNSAAASALTFMLNGVKGLIPATAIFAALAVAIKAGTAKFDAYNDAVENTAAAQSKLGEYKDELADLESRTDTLTEAERHRLEVLREITAEQEKQVQQAKQEEYEAYSEAYGSGTSVATGMSGTGSGGIGGWGRVESVQRDIYQATEYQKQLNDLQEQYANQTAESAMSTDEYYAALQTLNDGYADTIDKLRAFMEAGIEVTDSERALVLAYDEAQVALGNVSQSAQIVTDAYKQLVSTGEISKSTWQTLIAYYPQLADGAVQTANGYQIQQSALENLMSAESRQAVQAQNVVNGMIAEAQQAGYTGQALYNYVASLITASDTQLSVSQQIAALQALAVQAGYSAQAIAQVFAYANAAGTYQADSAQVKQLAGELLQSGKARSVSEAFNMAKKQLTASAWGNLTSNYQPTTGTVSVPKAGVSGGGASSAASNQASQAQAEIKRLQAEQDKVQDQIDAINDKYDQQLKELEDINDELEDQIRLQELLQDLAEAKSRTKMVFKDGRFQYIQDTDAVSKAQANLDEYYREKELAAKKKQIEAERQLELSGLQAEKKRLEERIKYWRNFSSDMSGVYSSSLSDLTDYVNNWNAKIDSMKKPSTDTSGGGGTYDDVVEDPLVYETNKKIAAAYPSADYNTNHNSRYSTAETKELQTWYGTSADGVWGKNSYAAAGNRNISTAWSLYQRVKSQYSSFAAFKAKGGYARGTLSAQSGISMVGEQGPELRVLNKGDGVIPAKQTARLWSFANDPAKFLQTIANYRGGMSEVINVQNVTLPNVRNAQDFVAGLRNLAYQRAYAR